MSKVNPVVKFCNRKLMDVESVFEEANANSDMIYLKGMLELGGIQTQLIANIGKRQAFQEVLEYIRKEGLYYNGVDVDD